MPMGPVRPLPLFTMCSGTTLPRLLEAPEPTADALRLVVRVSHPQHGDFFLADLRAVRSAQPEVLSERGGWTMLWR